MGRERRVRARHKVRREGKDRSISGDSRALVSEVELSGCLSCGIEGSALVLAGTR